MSLRLTLILTACFSMSACATVDLNDVATKNQVTRTSAVDINVVQRAATKLYAAFSSRGFVAKDSRKRVQSAARILLKGLEEKDVRNTEAETSYMASAMDKLTVLSDIRLASNHVEQTTKAAEVYLVMVPVDKSVRKELASLEKALLASREASRVFEDALIKTSGDKTAVEFSAFETSVDELRNVTNAFGDRVRGAQTTQIAAIF